MKKILCALAALMIMAPGGVQAKNLKKQKNDLETITVTAQKQEENIHSVPISITVLDEIAIEDIGIGSMDEIGDFIPNLMIYGHGTSGMFAPVMRGISSNVESMKVSTGLYVDGISVLNGIGFDQGILDIERIEVLRGPQGTLYGKGAETGAINIITRQPNNEFKGWVSGNVGKRLSSEAGDAFIKEFSFGVSGPIVTNKLFFGIAGKYLYKDGFIKNSLTDDAVDERENFTGKFNLRWAPSDRLDIAFMASALRFDSGDVAFTSIGKNREVSSDLKGHNDSEGNSQSIKIAYDINENFTFTSASSNWIYKHSPLQDWDFSQAPPEYTWHFDTNNEYGQLAQEFRLDYSTERMKWLIGLYYDKQHNEINYTMNSLYETSRDYDGKTYAVFSNITFPFTEKLSLVTGLRYEHEKQEYEDNILKFKLDDSWHGLTPKVALEYTFLPETMVYMSASKGYRSGGFNVTEKNPQYYSYDQEELWSYELGVKNTLLNNRLQISASVYYMEIDDMQVDQNINQAEFRTTNAGEAKAKGFEMELMARFKNGLSLMAGGAYTDVEFEKFNDSLGNYEGNQNPWAPKYTFNFSVQYRHTKGFFARADIVGYGKMYLDKANKFFRDPYQVVNGKIGYEFANFDIYLYGKNLFDEKYNTKGYGGGFYTLCSEPGEVGLKIGCKF